MLEISQDKNIHPTKNAGLFANSVVFRVAFSSVAGSGLHSKNYAFRLEFVFFAVPCSLTPKCVFQTLQLSNKKVEDVERKTSQKRWDD